MVQEQALDRVLKRWPAWGRRIKDLVAVDNTFREACEDYAELAGWIEANRGGTPQRLETAIQLLESLAVEIAGFLASDESTVPPGGG